ncbi:MAG: efflux transporter outer membrane subunit [Candidatus Brevundimonas colombiensis]|uniref:Efflux transporter outer membrane subunit n=1 Tax=Candidatus Brevundimonas colombiensis TaxID=3121376 RepID=A0AAJ5X5S8_9CAUL|nr:efflux transporter outer membrane subunit [Brevundimonas sp.]WEK41578.1 MAG: efflux transporter outer membrane subunit [Brevundimonas sp.]
MKRLLLLGTAGALLSACASIEPVEPAADVVSADYPVVAAIDSANAADLDWRAVFVDPQLQQLVDIALDESRPLRLALLDAETARAQLRVQRASFFPMIGAAGSYSRSRSAPLPGFQDAGVVTQAQATVGVSAFELDLFGRLRAQSESAFQTYLAAGESAQAARITLSASVADAYVATLTAQERLALVEATAQDWRASQTLTQRLFEAGQADGTEVAAAEAQVRTAEADLEAARREAAVALNALVLVVGRPLPFELATPSSDASPVLTQLPAGLPSNLLTRRPDIRQAERALLASRADIRAARRAFLPSISLTGQYGYASNDLDNLFDGPEVWTFAPQITLPIFQGGRLQAQLDLAILRQNKAVASYELAIQQAFSEVADGLAARETFDRQIAAQRSAVEASQRRSALVETRYRAGATSRLELLDAQRQLYAGQQALLAAKAAQMSASIALYRALGGGPVAERIAPA